MSRVISFGCSHACGCEIEGAGISWSQKNIESSFGYLVAKHFNKEFKLSARPGASNRQIFLNAIEHAQPDDICLLSWTYFNRENWFAEDDTSKLRSDVFNGHQMLHTLELNNAGMFQHITNKFYRTNKTVADQMRANIDARSQYCISYNDEELLAVAKAWDLHHSRDMVRVIDFLESFHAANAIIKQRGAIPINFHFAEERHTYYDFLNKSRPILSKPYKHDFYFDFNTPEYCLIVPNGNNLKLFNDYINNNDFIRFYDKNGYPISFKYSYCEKVYNDPYISLGDRMGHLDASAHEVLSTHIIDKLATML
jgi:hypothetical protein